MRQFARFLRVIVCVIPALVVVWVGHDAFSKGVLGHQDEPAWIASGYYFELLRKGDLRNPDWWLLPARESPPVGKYIFGAVIRVFGRPIRSIEPLAAWHQGWYIRFGLGFNQDENGALRRALSERLSRRARMALLDWRFGPIADVDYLVARWTAVAFGMIAAAAVAAIGLSCRSPLTGLASGVIFALHPLVIEAYTHALFDIIALAFSALAVRALVGVAGPAWTGAIPSRGATLLRGLAAGLLLSLAVGTKMNALIVVFVAAALALVLVGRACRVSSRGVVSGVAALVIALGFAFVIFVAINPTLYPDPERYLRELFTIPAMTTRWQASFLPDYLETPRAKLTTVGTLVTSWSCGLIPLAVIALGPTWLGLRRLSARTVVVVWWWLALAAVVAWIPFPWERYVLPLLPPAAVLVADAAVGLVRLALRLIRAAITAALWRNGSGFNSQSQDEITASSTEE